jgi:hypothetical protein
MSNYYVYLHLRKTNNKVFYVGKGKGKRAWSRHSRNKHWNHIVNKHDFLAKIVDKDLSEEQAFELETFMIDFIGFENLCNMTFGGEGVSGLKHSEETRAKISSIHKGRIVSKEMCAKISAAKKASITPELRLKISQANKGRFYSKETRLKLSISKTDHNIYVFYNEKLDMTEKCTRSDLCEKYNIKSNTLRKLFQAKAYKKSKGWSLVTEG